MTTTRRLFKSSRYAPQQARELIEAIFVAELIDPSRTLWIVSPWIRDLAVIDNTSMSFSGLDPGWGARTISLSEIVTRLSELGSHVVIVTRPDDLNAPFLRRIDEASSQPDASSVVVVERQNLHEKGVLGDDFHLGGSMNLTYMGVEINEEALVFETDSDAIARAHGDYAHGYGPPQSST